MKEFIKAFCVIGGCLFLIPLIIVYAQGYEKGELLQKVSLETRLKESGNVSASLLDEEKLIGMLAKEIPYTYEYETIKAQAVVIRTYMARRALGIQIRGALEAYTEEELKALWKEDYKSIYATYEEAIKETTDEMILYKGEPIEALYHGASGGTTRDAKSVYGVEVPYLKSVVSNGDTISKQIKISKSEVVRLIKEKYDQLIADVSTLENQIQIIEKDEAEYVMSIQIGNVILKGEELRAVLGLPSSHFKIFTAEDSLIFDVKGIGHGVGLSQNGANELAKQGKTYKEIIAHYYKDVEIQNYSQKQ